MTQRQQRTARGFLAAALAVFVAALFHIAGGGAAPTPLSLVVSVVLATPACVLLAGRRPSAGRLTASVALSQLAFHLLFELGQPSSVRFSGGEMAGMPGMPLHVAGTGGGASASIATPAMWASHAMAALVTIVAIRHGERVLERMLQLASRFVVRVVRLAQLRPLPRVRVLTQQAAPAVRAPLFLSGAIRHRGPPALFA